MCDKFVTLIKSAGQGSEVILLFRQYYSRIIVRCTATLGLLALGLQINAGKLQFLKNFLFFKIKIFLSTKNNI